MTTDTLHELRDQCECKDARIALLEQRMCELEHSAEAREAELEASTQAMECAAEKVHRACHPEESRV